jgi:hypothetical protein
VSDSRPNTRTFIARDADGVPVTVHARVRRDGLIDLVTVSGRSLTRVEKGRYRVEETGEMLTSDDPTAP